MKGGFSFRQPCFDFFEQYGAVVKGIQLVQRKEAVVDAVL